MLLHKLHGLGPSWGAQQERGNEPNKKEAQFTNLSLAQIAFNEKLDWDSNASSPIR